MEEDKAAAYYEELTRKGEGAARFKQGLGFSSSSTPNDIVSSSFLTTFVKASSPTATCHKQAQLQFIHNKLTHKKTHSSSPGRVSDTDKHREIYRDRDKYRDRDRDRDRDQRHRRRPLSRDRERRSRRRSRSRSDSDGERRGNRDRRRRRSRSVSPGKRKLEKRGEGIKERKNMGIDYTKFIRGYDKMSPAERVKAKMKFQLSETAEKDAMNGMGSGWERFEFDKDAPLDDEEMEVADDDVALVKHIGQSFRFSTVEANRDDQIKAAHDEAMFGSSRVLPSTHAESIADQENESKIKESASVTSLLSDKVGSVGLRPTTNRQLVGPIVNLQHWQLIMIWRSPGLVFVFDLVNW